jgi:hypothetical protein
MNTANRSMAQHPAHTGATITMVNQDGSGSLILPNVAGLADWITDLLSHDPQAEVSLKHVGGPRELSGRNQVLSGVRIVTADSYLTLHFDRLQLSD